MLFGKERAQDHAFDYIKELMVCPERKSIEPIALQVGQDPTLASPGANRDAEFSHPGQEAEAKYAE